jgi:predicted ATPase with chaperone activity
MSENTSGLGKSLLAAIMMDESYRPIEPTTVLDAGVPASLIEGLLLKRLLVVGQSSGRQLANDICLSFTILEDVYQALRARQFIVHRGSAPLNDYTYALTETGRERAQIAMKNCAYVGPVPVPLSDYILSVEAQSVRNENPKHRQLQKAFNDISIDEQLFDELGPAINSGAGLFLYGEPGNGKTTIAQRITRCFGQDVWIPHAIHEDGEIIKVYDVAYHRISQNETDDAVDLSSHDRRWLRVSRPTVMVGGELTLDALEIRFDPNSKVSEAPLQLKSNCGTLLIDDFGRQRIEPRELLNRWIVPLENRYDFLTLSTGKKIKVPFEQLIIFSTNLEPASLVDEAFLRRIPYKINVGDPGVEEFHELFQAYCDRFECEYRAESVNYLLEKHYVPRKRRLRRCQPRDFLQQLKSFCNYYDLPMDLNPEYIDRVIKSYFTSVLSGE